MHHSPVLPMLRHPGGEPSLSCAATATLRSARRLRDWTSTLLSPEIPATNGKLVFAQWQTLDTHAAEHTEKRIPPGQEVWKPYVQTCDVFVCDTCALHTAKGNAKGVDAHWIVHRRIQGLGVV